MVCPRVGETVERSYTTRTLHSRLQCIPPSEGVPRGGHCEGERKGKLGGGQDTTRRCQGGLRWVESGVDGDDGIRFGGREGRLKSQRSDRTDAGDGTVGKKYTICFVLSGRCFVLSGL